MKIIRHIAGFSLILSLLFNCASLSAREQRVPLPAALTLNEAAELLSKDLVTEAITLLEAFKSKSRYSDEEAIHKPDPKGYHHHLIGFLLGNLYLMQEDPDKAMRQYQWVTQKKPTYQPAWTNLAKAYFDLALYDQAANAFTRSYLLSNDKPPEYLYYAAMALSNEHPDDALNVFERLLTYHPDQINVVWKKSLVTVFFSLERFSDAFPYIIEIIDAETGTEQRKWQQILLSQYINLALKTKALAYVEHLVTTDPIYPDWWKTLAHLKLEEELYVETLSALMIYSKLAPLTLKEQKLMASLCLSLDIPIQSSKIFESIVSQEINRDIITGLAQSYSRLYQPEKVIQWISTGLEQFEDEYLRLLRANLWFQAGNYQNAIDDYKTILAQNPERGEAWLMMGYAYLNFNDRAQAVTAFRSALDFPKQQKAAEKILSQIKTSHPTK